MFFSCRHRRLQNVLFLNENAFCGRKQKTVASFGRESALFAASEFPFPDKKCPFLKEKGPLCFRNRRQMTFFCFQMTPFLVKHSFFGRESAFSSRKLEMIFVYKKVPFLPLPKMPCSRLKCLFWTRNCPFVSKTGE